MAKYSLHTNTLIYNKLAATIYIELIYNTIDNKWDKIKMKIILICKEK